VAGVVGIAGTIGAGLQLLKRRPPRLELRPVAEEPQPA
jgi:hypothetical protein